MAAITWRNVNGPSLGESSDILTAAGNSFNAGLGTLDKMLKQREAVELANQEAVVKNNGNAYQNLLASAKTPEELAALEGKLAEAGASYGGQIDPALLRDGMRNQMNQLRTQTTQDRAYQDAETERGYDPTILQARQLRAEGKTQEAAALLAGGNYGSREVEISQGLRSDEQAAINQTRANELTTLNLQAARDSATDTQKARATVAEDQAIQMDALAYSDVRNQQKQQTGLALGQIAVSKGYPVNAAGMVDKTLMNTAQRADMTLEAKKLGIDFDTYGTGDTKDFTNYVSSLKNTGKHSAAAIDRNMATLQGRFNTANTGAAVGNDAVNAARVAAQQEVIDNEDRTTNWHAPGSANAMNTYEVVAKEIPMLIDSTTGFDAEEDIGPMQSFLHEMATVGVDIGNGEMVTPSVNDLRAVIRSADGGLFKDSTRAANAKEALIKIMRTTSAKDKIIKAEDIKIRDRGRAAKAILNNAK